MDENTDIQLSETSDAEANGGDIKRPRGKYDNLILFVERFPLRLFVVIIGLSVCMNYHMHLGELTYVIPGAPFGASLLYLLMGVALFGEMFTGWLTRHIKDFIIRRIMRAEENAEIL